MKVINKDHNGNEIDLGKITVPKDNLVYQTLEGIYDRDSNKNSNQEKPPKEKLRIHPGQR